MNDRNNTIIIVSMFLMMIIGIVGGVWVGTQLGRQQISITCPEAPEATLVLLSPNGELKVTEAESFLNSWLGDEASFTTEVGVDSLTIVKEANDRLESVMLFAH